MLTRAELRESLAVQEWLEEGREEGRQEGSRAAAEELLRSALRRFPSLTLPAELPAGLDVLQLARDIVAAPDETSARLVVAARGLIS